MMGGNPDAGKLTQWAVILYCDYGDRCGDRNLIGPFSSLRDAEGAVRRLEGYGDIEIRRLVSVDAIEWALGTATGMGG